MAVPYTFGSATTSIPLSQLDSNFATPITLGNTAVQLGNTITNLTGITNLASSGALTIGSNGNTTALTIDTSQNTKLTTAGTKILNSSGNPILQQTGSILQVVTTNDNTIRNTTGNFPQSTGVSVTITPTSSTSKILVLVDWATWVTVGSGTNGNKIGIYGIYRGGSSIITQRMSLSPPSGAWVDLFVPVNMHILDSPATTSATTYTLYWGRLSSSFDNTLYMNDTNQSTQLTAIEVAA